MTSLKQIMAALAVCGVMGVASVQAQEYVVNGDFSAGGANWTLVSDGYSVFVPDPDPTPTFYEGTQYKNGQGSISQTLANPAGSFLFQLDITIFTETGGTEYVYWNGNLLAGGFLNGHYAFNVEGLGNDVIRIAGNNDPYYNFINNVSVTAVPEPETYAMMLAGLGLLGFSARRRKQKTA